LVEDPGADDDLQRHDPDAASLRHVGGPARGRAGDDDHARHGATLTKGGHTTMLTSFGARTITLRTVAPSIARCTPSSAIAAASRSASDTSGETSRRARTLPLTWTTAVTVSSTSSASSTAGHPTRATVGSWPSR